MLRLDQEQRLCWGRAQQEPVLGQSTHKEPRMQGKPDAKQPQSTTDNTKHSVSDTSL